MSASRRPRRTERLVTSPAIIMLFAWMIVPLVMTVLLSFHDWGQYKGIEPVFVLKNWHEVFTDSYFLEMFWRTFRIAFFVTLLTALFGVIMSLEPAIAALLGFAILDQALAATGIVAIAMVSVASAGATLGSREPPVDEESPALSA